MTFNIDILQYERYFRLKIPRFGDIHHTISHLMVVWWHAFQPNVIIGKHMLYQLRVIHDNEKL